MARGHRAPRGAPRPRARRAPGARAAGGRARRPANRTRRPPRRARRAAHPARGLSRDARHAPRRGPDRTTDRGGHGPDPRLGAREPLARDEALAGRTAKGRLAMTDDDYLWDRSGEPDRTVSALESELARHRWRGRLPQAALPARAPRRAWRPLSLAAGLAALALGAAWWWSLRATPAVPAAPLAD